MKKIAGMLFVLCCFLGSDAQALGTTDLKVANRYYVEQSYQLAAGEYEKFLGDTSNEVLAREVLFKWSDCIVKGQDESRAEQARKNLHELIDGKTYDRWWAEAGVTLAVHDIAKDPYSKAQDVKKYLDDARDYWAGSSDIDLARARFIEISFMLADFVTTRWGWYSSDIRPIRLGDKAATIAPPQPPQGNQSLQMLFEEILKIAKSDADKAKASYGLTMTYTQNYNGDVKLKKKAAEQFQKIIKNFPSSEWVDDAYYQLGNFYESQSDFVKAAETYRAFIARFRAGESQWLDDAQRKLDAIVKPDLHINLSNTFVPSSEIQFGMNWRNLKQANLTLYKLDLTKMVGLMPSTSEAGPTGTTNYQELLRQLVEKTGNYKALPVQFAWKTALDDDGKHGPHSEHKGLAEWRKDKDAQEIDPKKGALPIGAYLLVASADGATPAYDLVLVSDVAIVNKIAKDAALFFTIDAKTGKPRASAAVKYIYSWYDERGQTHWEEGAGSSDENGLLKVNLKSNATRNYSQQHGLFAAVIAGDSQAFVQNNYYQYNNNNKGEWRLYTFSDRPAYRPNETVSFKGILRQYGQGAFANAAGKSVKARLYDARNNQVKEAIYTLNDYGAFQDTLILDEKAALGEYRLELYTEDLQNHLATATLFRLEEYKLPEYAVAINPQPKEKDNKSAANGYRLGDTINVDVDASYYFGGPVANAQVEYLVYQQPFAFHYAPTRPYAWYYEDMLPGRNNDYGGNGQLLVQKKIPTGADGKAHFTIETPKDSGNDLQYHIEVRVVDQSRRAIRATRDLKVTKNAYFAHLEAKQNLYRPGDKAQITIRTMTPNEEPVSVEGKVTVLRNWWRDPVIQNEKIASPGHYDGQEIVTKFVKTNERGETVFEFEPNDDGYYVVEFTGFDNGKEVKGQAQVFVCKSSSINIGYQYSGLMIITEKDTYAVGDTARTMIVADRPDVWVLLSQEAEDFLGYQLLHLEGSVKLVEIPIQENYTPNIFLNLLSGDHYQLKTNTVQLIVPPEKKFLTITVTSDKTVYQPQAEGTFDITVTDKDGKPVSAEIALGLTDAAVYGIQDEYAPDIRKFFYGDKRQQSVQTQASFYQRPYINLVRGDNDQLISDEERMRQKRNNGPVDAFSDRDSSSIVQLRAEIGGRVAGRFVGAKDDLGKTKGVYSQSEVTSAAVGIGAQKEEDGADERKPPKQAYKQLAALDEREQNKNGSGLSQEEPEQVRNDFRSTVIWQPAVVTDANGKTTIKVKFPDSLTTWRLTARANTPGTAVGTMTHEVKSNKELMVRLQAPRFFTERDLAAVSALIDNLSDKPVTVSPQLKVTGLTVTGLYQDGKFVKGEFRAVEIPAHGQKRVDWAVSAQQAGQATIKVSVKAGKLVDAMERSYPVIPHGIEKFIAKSLVLKSAAKGGQTGELTINIPKERIKQSTSLRMTIAPSLAANLLDALPYLADYPYGCVEQTMSRFLPAVIVAKTMRDLGISAQDVDAYISDVLEPRGDPKGHPQRRTDPTYGRLKSMTAESLTRLYDFQHTDGGWGWWKEGDSDRLMSAYVVWGLGLARDAGLEIKSDVIAKGIAYLQKQLVEEENQPDMLAWMLHGLAYVDAKSAFEDKQRNRLWTMRDKINPYTRALFALSEHRRGDTERSHILAQNLANGIAIDKENGTAHWGESGVHYRWSDGGVEATAFAIKALSQIEPQSPYLDPAVKWLTLNRRGARWKNTRDTAIAILGLADYLKATRELTPDYKYQVIVNGKTVRDGQINSGNVFSFDRIIDVAAEALRDGDNSIKIVMNGQGALYASAHAKYFTLEEGVTKAGNEIFVTRKYYKQSVKETLMKGYTNDWTALNDGDEVASGDRVRVDVTLDAKNNHEYLIAEDYKPAGLEAVELKSGAGEAIALDREGRETNARIFLYQEFRDQKAVFFISALKQGKHLIRYELRAEVPGEFHAMPDQIHAMYVPEIRANSDEMRLGVNDLSQ